MTTITKTRIGNTNVYVLAAWEPTNGPCSGEHSTIQNRGGTWYGRVGTRSAPVNVTALKAGSPERCQAVDIYRANQYAEAYTAIISEYPEAATGHRRHMGEIEMVAS